MAPQRRGERPLRRRAPQIDERARFVIFCEGELTEPLYLKAFASLQEVRSVATLDIRGMGCEPRKLVEEARVTKRSEQGQSTEITKYWCVFDVEAPTQHARLNEAVQMARDNASAWRSPIPASSCGWYSTTPTTRAGSITTTAAVSAVDMTARRARASTALPTCRGDTKPSSEPGGLRSCTPAPTESFPTTTRPLACTACWKPLI